MSRGSSPRAIISVPLTQRPECFLYTEEVVGSIPTGNIDNMCVAVVSKWAM